MTTPNAVSANGWDYSSSLPPDMSTDFKNSYFVGIKDTQTVKVDGLVTLAHLKGFTEFTTELVESPTQANQMNAIFKATIKGYGWDPIEEKVIPVTVVRYGDANPTNCNKMVAAHFIRMAETRAVGRLLRAYLNVTFVTLEELALVVQVPMLTQDQFTRMTTLCSQYNIDQTASFKVMTDSTGKDDINSLTLDEANVYIASLSNYGASLSGAMSTTQAPVSQAPMAQAPQMQPVASTPPAQRVVQPLQNPPNPGQPQGNYNLE